VMSSGRSGIAVEGPTDQPRRQTADFIAAVLRATTVTRSGGPSQLGDVRPRPAAATGIIQVRRGILAVVFEHRLLSTMVQQFNISHK